MCFQSITASDQIYSLKCVDLSQGLEKRKHKRRKTPGNNVCKKTESETGAKKKVSRTKKDKKNKVNLVN